jgi:hypothetical protein
MAKCQQKQAKNQIGKNEKSSYLVQDAYNPIVRAHET